MLQLRQSRKTVQGLLSMRVRVPPPTISFFDPKVFERLGQDYPQALDRNFSGSRIIESDVEIFQDLARFDARDFYKTAIAGPITLRIAGRLIDCTKDRKKTIEISGSVEPDRIRFEHVQAAGILYVEIGTVYDILRSIQAWKKLNLLLISGYGIPRPRTRRLLHRFSTELKLPIYVLTDNDTWGYYIYSVLKRGSIAPNRNTPELAVRDVRFLGHQAGELKLTDNPDRYLIPWKPYWDLRLKAMAKYPCFRSRAWQVELKNFRAQRGKYEGYAMAYGLSRRPARNRRKIWSNYVDNYFLWKLQNHDWLT